jgi:hypothetical protein
VRPAVLLTLAVLAGATGVEAAAAAVPVTLPLARGTTSEGCATTPVTAPVSGLLSARLGGSPGGADWDLAVRGRGRLLGASRAFGGAELVQVPVTAGDRVDVRACGTGAPVPLEIEEVVGLARRRAPELRPVSVRVPTRAAARRLAALELDTAEVSAGGRATVLLHGAADARRLRAAGFVARAPERPRRRARRAAAAVPSGRADYRELADYQADLKRLVAEHPGLVRPVVLPGASVQGRPIEGVEIAEGVERLDDGRPVHVEVGLHHAREWPSGEMVMEHAFDLAGGAEDPRLARLLGGVRTFILPVVNPDGLVASQDSLVAGDPSTGSGSYKRKNCAGGVAGTCGDGVDLNRNYGAFWGGPGASGSATSQTFRGPAPFSEPESRAFRAFSSTHQVMVINSNHSYGGTVLHQPGFSRVDEPGLRSASTLPYADRLAALAESMAAAAGYRAGPAYSLYDVTGATEDWNYFAQGAFAFTTEIGGNDFHEPYADGVAGQWPGMRELMLRAGEAAMDPAGHAVISGSAPAGRTLRLSKDFSTSTSYVDGGEAQALPEHLETTLTVPADGRYRWAVTPSTRPVVLLAGGTEAWTLTCEDGSGAVLERRSVTVGLGEARTQDLACGMDGVAAIPDPSGGGAPGATLSERLRLR